LQALTVLAMLDLNPSLKKKGFSQEYANIGEFRSLYFDYFISFGFPYFTRPKEVSSKPKNRHLSHSPSHE
jgi:hypothetical protein